LAVTDQINQLINQPIKVPKSIQERMDRGRARMKDGAAKRNECLAFWRSDQYRYTNEKNQLVAQSTITNYLDRSGKPPHRARTTRNLIFDVVEREVSASTSRVPSYEVSPSTTDPEDIGAARLAEKVALYGYDKWGIRSATESAVRYAVIADEGFVWPYFDTTVGPYIQLEDGTSIGQGEVKIRVLGPNEVYWEPGLNFEESRWHAIEQARDIESIQQVPGFVGGKITPDAFSSDIANRKVAQNIKLVMVTDYLERPSPQYPQGRWLTIANNRVVVPERAYPCTDGGGEVIDEPVLHKLSYAKDPDSDRDQGLVRHLLDSQRAINNSVNKTIEWIALALNPQVIIQNGEFKQRLTDEPGQVYHAVGSGQITWRPVPPVPPELFTTKSQAEGDMARIAAQNDIPSNVESARGIQALIERDTGRKQSFIANLAEFHSRLMRHCLYLVQKHYTEERLLKVRGRFGPEILKDFTGAQLRSQVDITVLPGSLEPRTKAAIEQRIMNFAQLGWITPEAAMSAINSGTAEKLVEGYELDVARANQVIQKIKDGSFILEPPRPLFPGEGVDPVTGQPPMDLNTGQPISEAPGWMPRPFDNIRVHKTVFEDWMKTSDYESLPPEARSGANEYYQALLSLEAAEAQRAAQLQQQQAQDQGMFNAAKPQQASPLPSLPGAGGEAAPQ